MKTSPCVLVFGFWVFFSQSVLLQYRWRTQFFIVFCRMFYVAAIDYLNSSVKCTAGNFFFSNGYWNEICHVQTCQISHVGGLAGLHTHTQSGGQMASTVCWRPRPSLPYPRDPFDSKWVWQTGGVCACLSVFGTGEDRDIRSDSPNMVSVWQRADLTVHCASA